MKMEGYPFIQNFPGDFGKSLVRHGTPCPLKEGEILFDEEEPAAFLVKTMVEAHGGAIALSSETGKGTEFQRPLPVPSCRTVGRETG